jgi:hypothetical protein
MEYFVKISIDNDVFVDNAGAEIALILRNIAERIEMGVECSRISTFKLDDGAVVIHDEREYQIKDSNGNTIGKHGYKQEVLRNPNKRGREDYGMGEIS